jgi:hypothetical protein
MIYCEQVNVLKILKCFICLIKCSRKYILKLYAPKFAGRIGTTGEQIIRIED